MTRPIYYRRWKSPLGDLHLYSSESRLVAVAFEKSRRRILKQLGPVSIRPGVTPVLEESIAQLKRYFEGRLTRFDIPVEFATGTDFQKAAWRALGKISYGETVSYRDHAAGAGARGAYRAIGAAIGRNPLAIILPCHRVVGSNGSLTGYAGGVVNKSRLLRLESDRRDPVTDRLKKSADRTG